MSPSDLIRWGGLAGMLAGVIFVVEAFIAMLYPARVGNHATSVGFLSEALFAAALLFVMINLLGLHTRQAGNYGLLGKTGFYLTVVGVVLALPQLVFVLLTGEEVAAWLVTPGALAVLVGFVLIGVATFRAGVLPRWCGVGLVIFFPVVFFGGYVGGFVAGLIWLTLGYSLWSQRYVPDEAPQRVR